MIDIVVPQVGEAIAEVTLVRWLKQEGDAVAKGDALFEVDTEKATFEIEAFADGTLVEILAPDGAAVAPLQIVGRLIPVGGDVDAAPGRQPANEGDAVPLGTADSPVDRKPLDRPRRRDGALATPRARRLARELGVDLATVQPAGDASRINVADVERAAQASHAIQTSEQRPPSDGRAAIARRVQGSTSRVPHFYLRRDVDMGEVLRLRAAWQGPDRAPSVTAILVKASVAVLAADPSLAVSWRDDRVTPVTSEAVGVAVDTPIGVQIVTIRARERTVAEVADGLRAAAERARAGRLHPDDAAPKSLVISNLGMHDVDAFFAIIDEPDSMILSVGRTTDRVVAVDGAPTVRPIASLGLAIDHRALDGVAGARFLAAVRGVLEHPGPHPELRAGT